MYDKLNYRRIVEWIFIRDWLARLSAYVSTDDRSGVTLNLYAALPLSFFFSI